jgi:hypothetical protein
MIIRTLKIGQRYYTIENSVLGFVNEASARACKNFLERHRTLYGCFPAISRPTFYKHATETGRITVNRENLSGLQERCRDYGLKILGVHYFDYNDTTLELQAEELHDELGLVPTNPRLLLEREYNRAWWAGDHLE